MSSRRTDIDDFDVWYMYTVEKRTQQEIADYYGACHMTIYRRLYPDKQKDYNKKLKEYKKEWSQSNESRDYQREYRQSDKGNVYQKEYKKQWYLEHPEYSKEKSKQWLLENPGYAKQWRLENPEYLNEWRHNTKKGRLSVVNGNADRRGLGSIALNEPFDGSEFHHIDEYHGIYIPEELHRSIWHVLKTGQGMEEINEIAFEYVTEEMYDKYEMGEI